jgi:iron complex transport system ATP-binding protein
MNKLLIKHLTAGYNDKMVLHDINLACSADALTFIIGPNGCGKTTLLKSVAQLLKYQGKILFNDQDLAHVNDKERAQIMATFSQIASVNLDFTIIDTVVSGRYPYLTSNLSDYSPDDYQIARQALTMVGLDQQEEQLLAHCSGGQLQRVLIARLIAQDPQIIIIDEITNHLDFKYQIEVLDFIKDWACANEKIVLGVLHDINLVTCYADQVVLLKDGRILAQGAPKKVLTKTNLKELYDVDVVQWYHDIYQKWFTKK